MNPPERIKLISESAELLAKREYPEMDLILDQFGMSTSETWDGDPKSYAIQMMRFAEDDSLRGLHQFLTGHSNLQGIAGGPHPWKDRGLRLFMSHLAQHQGEVGKVADWLVIHGVDAFVAHTSIEPSAEWQDVIESALRSCNAMAVFLHKGFHESKWCDQEVGFALGRQDVPVLPLKIDLNPYGFMGKLQADNCSNLGPIQVAHKILDWLMRRPELRDAAIECLVSGFENSDSFDNTRHLLLELEVVPTFTQDQLYRLDMATTENSQIAKAWISGTSVPKRVERLIEARQEALSAQ
jgi:hypothetical protein